MFDVSWSEHAGETVGERKSRKDQQPQGPTVGPLTSSDSSQAKRPSLLARLNGSKTGKSPQTASHANFPGLRSEHSNSSTKSLSTATAVSDWSMRELPETTPTMTSTSTQLESFSTGPSCVETDQSMSVFSGWTSRSTSTESSWGSVSTTGTGCVVQPLSSNSYVIQSTEVTVSPRDSFSAGEHVATIVSISSAGNTPQQLPDSPTKGSPITSHLESPAPNVEETPVMPIMTDILLHHSGWPMTTSGEQVDSWRPPETWDCPSEDASQGRLAVAKSLKFAEPAGRQANEPRRSSTTSESMNLYRSIKRMEAASPKIVLERLKEEWIEIVDAALYRELELEKQLWMLTVLRSLNKKKLNGNPDERKIAPAVEVEVSRSTKILSLYESEASSSYLSALNQVPEIHHLSTQPLSPESYPNVYPLAVPSPTSQLPYASNIFSAIHAFSLPALLPSSSIPNMLRECHRTLISSSPSTSTKPASTTQTPTPPGRRVGTLYLTVLDPSPSPSTLGPRLRAWLDSHLIMNLEKQFRCINPGRLFPVWLADAGLRAEGSTVVTVRFLASVGSSSSSSSAGNSDAGVRESTTDETKAELESVVGRMLWKEMWSSSVDGDRWWWEDEDIVEECERLGTSWEYSLIEAVKEG